MEILRIIFTPGNFEPHGVHFADTPALLWIFVVTNSLISLAYLILPAQLSYIYFKRRDFVFSWVFIVIAFFGVWCSATHALNVVVLFYPVYWLEGIVNVITGVVSFVSFIAYAVATPMAIALAGPDVLRARTDELSKEAEKHRRAVREMEALNAKLLEANKESSRRSGELAAVNKVAVDRELKISELKEKLATATK